ncbi:GTP-binding protein [Alkaliphilus peptidifermentans]|uniref:Ni2+-binding GTPase involved in regulation of expression and maturation of urease and hydrogenase n=1 Tax=Alkaliphilus peptidifermentans DSM 18978 TaxID=1120976 RepID=A0A1G5IIG0_9FIRM|nr:GTP-binding protein [Alkaliphilus peptidifermentans]SCY75915.1 Ni2+-binding GTPase involved in regulation of expression and maturation of urease and hydrogenase [Alkaliphilus peptidifermentans DSM 18978]
MITIIVGGAPASGKTGVLKHVIRYLQLQQHYPAVCKIDCIQSNDKEDYKSLNIPVIQGLSLNICPDHFLATNIIDIFEWGKTQKATHLFMETAGLCNRCAPFINRALNICVIDSMGSIKGPEKLGPLVSTADILVLAKFDLVSQAEREVLTHHLSLLNPEAFIIEVNGLSGFGVQRLAKYILNKGQSVDSLEEDQLRYSMPAANCSYCVGEIRIGRNYQQGIINRIIFEEEVEE